VQQQQEGGKRTLGVLAAETQDGATRTVGIIVNLPDALALPFPELHRLANVPPFRDSASPLDEPDCPCRTPAYWSSQGIAPFAARFPALAAVVV
jgi:hypothetical protein